MAASVGNSELPAFGEFIQRLSGRGECMTADEAVVAFRHYQRQLAQFKRDVQPAVDELDAGKATELDVSSIISEGRKILSDEGSTD